MDPLTLFALANGAVAAVKKGCQLYKDIKGAAGDVKAVLKDLDEQFHGAFEAKGKTPTTEQRNEVNDMVLQIQKLLDGKEWGPSLAALTICIGDMGEMIRLMPVE